MKCVAVAIIVHAIASSFFLDRRQFHFLTNNIVAYQHDQYFGKNNENDEG